MLNTILPFTTLFLAAIAAPSQNISSLKRRSVSSDQNQQIIQIHNELRAKYGSLPLFWNYELEKQAQEYSDSCPSGHSWGAWRGDTPIPYGENIAWVNGLPEDQRLEWMVRTWLAEEKNYDFNSPVVTQTTGHFTQVVWRKSTSVGCGLTVCGPSSWTLVCQYNPPGNWISYPTDLTDNVPNPNGEQSSQTPTTTADEVTPSQTPIDEEKNDEQDDQNQSQNDTPSQGDKKDEEPDDEGEGAVENENGGEDGTTEDKGEEGDNTENSSNETSDTNQEEGNESGSNPPSSNEEELDPERIPPLPSQPSRTDTANPPVNTGCSCNENPDSCEGCSILLNFGGIGMQ